MWNGNNRSLSIRRDTSTLSEICRRLQEMQSFFSYFFFVLFLARSAEIFLAIRLIKNAANRCEMIM